MLGLGNRTTLDMDATVDGLQMDETNIQRIIGEIIQIGMVMLFFG